MYHRVVVSFLLRECILLVADALAPQWSNKEERELFRKTVEGADEENLLSLAKQLGMNLPKHLR